MIARYVASVKGKPPKPFEIIAMFLIGRRTMDDGLSILRVLTILN